MTWLEEYSAKAEDSDRLPREDHVALLAAGLFGEAGSVLSEAKKHAFERDAYPLHREALIEEVGDVLWYYARLVAVSSPALLPELERIAAPGRDASAVPLGIAVTAGDVARQVAGGGDVGSALRTMWPEILRAAGAAGLSLPEIAAKNVQKFTSRWPAAGARTYGAFFDEKHGDVNIPLEERLPRLLEVEFIEKGVGSKPSVILRCNDLNFGDRLTDNIADPDGYRFHDCFHFAYAAVLGWSPVMRSLLRAKRKSVPSLDENEDGARAVIIEEAVSATVFARGRWLNSYEGLKTVDYVLLKRIQDFVRGYEVEKRPLWQWEEAILAGFSVFRLLKHNRGGKVKIDMVNHRLDYVAPRLT